MTSPGYPDYQSYAQWRAMPLVSGTHVITSVAPLVVSGLITNYASLDLYAELGAGTGFTLDVSYFTDQTLTTFMGGYEWVISGTQAQLQVTVPNLGNFVQVTFSTSQAGNQSVNAGVTPANVLATRPDYAITSNFVSGLNVPIAAGTTLSVTLPNVVDGDGYVMLNPRSGGGTTTAKVFSLGENAGNLALLADILNPGGPASATFLGASSPVQIQITNGDAASHNYDYYVRVSGR
jgi:hypothetical protein